MFTFYEYATAERAFIGRTLEALAFAKDPVLSQIQIERSGRVQTTQVTTDEGNVVEQSPVQVRTKLSQSPDEIISGSLEGLLLSLDKASDEYGEQLSRIFYDGLVRITKATGNVVDAKDRPFFESIYEMFEKIDLRFDKDGKIQQSLILNPADVAAWEKGFTEMTPEQHAALQALIDRKREEFNARQRSRRLPRRGN